MEVLYSDEPGTFEETEHDQILVRLNLRQEVVGLSILSGAHLVLARKVLEGLRARGAEEVRVVVGGIVPPRDVEPLLALGGHRVFPMGTPLPRIVAAFQEPM